MKVADRLRRIRGKCGAYRYLEKKGIATTLRLNRLILQWSGEYHMTMDPSEKDALLACSRSGLSLMESMGMASKADRFTSRMAQTANNDGRTTGEHE